MDDALVAPANRLKIGKSNLRLSSDLNSKEATLQVVYDVLKLAPFYKAFQIITDVPEIYMQEFGHCYSSSSLDSGEKKIITDVNVNKLHQPWRSFAAVINKCLSGKSTGYDSLRLSQAQILWGMYHKKNCQEEAGWDLTCLKDPLTKAKELKTSAKAAKTAKKKQPVKTSKAKGLTMLSEVALTEAEQIKLATKRSLIETHSSYTSGSGTDEGTCSKLGVPDVPTYESDDEQISWKSSDEEDDDEVGMNKDDEDNDDANDQDADDQDDDDQENDGQNDKDQDDEHTNSDNDGDDFVHPNDEEIQDTNVEGDKMNEEESNEELEVDALYRDVNVNLEGRDTEMTNAPRTIVQTTQVIEDTHVIITPVNPKGQQQSSSVSSGFVSNMLNPILNTCIDSLFNLNTESTSLVDVPVTTFAEPPLLSATTLPPPPTPLITHLQQTPVSTPLTVPSSSLQDLPNFGSLFGFDHRLKTLENNFSEFNQTNQFAAAVSLIPGIVDAYLANKMHEAVKTAVQLQSERLRDEAQAENADFLNKLDDNIKKIIKDQVKEQVKAQVSKILLKIEKTVNEQLEAELKKILIDKMESNKSIHRSDEQKNLYKALVDAYESDKLILDTYGDTVSFKRRRDDEDKEPFAGSNRGSKRRRAGKEPESTSAPKEKTSKTTGKSTKGSKSHHKSAGESAQAEEPMHTAKI
ncbi:hypothetical protein Tco_0692904 [Tanacetum coccineum]